jgi:hypothetical protein
MKLQRRRARRRAVAPVARKLAMILHAMWRDGSKFRFGQAHRQMRKLATIRNASDRQTTNEHPSYFEAPTRESNRG